MTTLTVTVTLVDASAPSCYQVACSECGLVAEVVLAVAALEVRRRHEQRHETGRCAQAVPVSRVLTRHRAAMARTATGPIPF